MFLLFSDFKLYCSIMNCYVSFQLSCISFINRFSRVFYTRVLEDHIGVVFIRGYWVSYEPLPVVCMNR
jgi:hypothetical protein